MVFCPGVAPQEHAVTVALAEEQIDAIDVGTLGRGWIERDARDNIIALRQRVARSCDWPAGLAPHHPSRLRRRAVRRREWASRTVLAATHRAPGRWVAILLMQRGGGPPPRFISIFNQTQLMEPLLHPPAGMDHFIKLRRILR